ncbi:MAG: hypothetical protein U0836_02640 [Pirellulales bacterium]
MKRFQLVGLVALALVAVATVGEAQEGGRRGGGRGMFGGGGDLLTIVSNEAVQSELKLDDAKKAEVAKVVEELREQFRGGGRGQGGGGQGQGGGAEFQARRQEQAKQAAEKLKAVVSEEQFKRLQQLQYQVIGVLGAAQNADLAAALSLDDATKQKLAALSDEQREALRDLREAVRDGSVQQDAVRTEMEKVRKELEEKAMALLTSEQKAKFTEVVGAPFDVSQLRGRGMGLGGGRGGRRGA